MDKDFLVRFDIHLSIHLSTIFDDSKTGPQIVSPKWMKQISKRIIRHFSVITINPEPLLFIIAIASREEYVHNILEPIVFHIQKGYFKGEPTELASTLIRRRQLAKSNRKCCTIRVSKNTKGTEEKGGSKQAARTWNLYTLFIVYFSLFHYALKLIWILLLKVVVCDNCYYCNTILPCTCVLTTLCLCAREVGFHPAGSVCLFCYTILLSPQERQTLLKFWSGLKGKCFWRLSRNLQTP